MEDVVTGIETRIRALLSSQELADQLANLDMDDAESVLRSKVGQISTMANLTSLGEKPRGPVRELEITWRVGLSGMDHTTKILLPIPLLSDLDVHNPE